MMLSSKLYSKKNVQLCIKVLVLASIVGLYFIVLLRESFAAWETTKAKNANVLNVSKNLAVNTWLENFTQFRQNSKLISLLCSVRHSNVMNESIESSRRGHHRHEIKFDHRPHWIRFMNILKKSISLPSTISVNGERISKKVAKIIISMAVIRQMRGNFSFRLATESPGAMYSKRPAAHGCIISIFWADTI